MCYGMDCKYETNMGACKLGIMAHRLPHDAACQQEECPLCGKKTYYEDLNDLTGNCKECQKTLDEEQEEYE